jgi:hypothetical protein
MSETINRMYDSDDRAIRAADELRQDRFNKFDYVYVFTRHRGRDSNAAGAEATTDDIVASMMKAYVLKANARVFAERVKQGRAMVTVHAPFGSAEAANRILDRYGPVDSGVPQVSDRGELWDEAAPCSSALNLPVLLADSASFSRFWNVPMLVRSGATTCSSLGIRELTDSSRPFTGTFGLPLISNKATPLSSLLGLPLLTKPRTSK